jgi:tetratricopeptide (TPR) repeat protein
MLSCSKNSNDQVFVEQYSGRYLYNSDEIIEVYFENNILFLKWSGANKITPLKTDDDTFFVKEMNEKIQFLTNPMDQKKYMVLVPKEDNENIVYNYRKLDDAEKLPNEYLKEFNYDKALEGYLAIKTKDSLDINIKEGNFNSLGYEELNKNNYEYAIGIFKINVALYPDSPNVYDSLGEAFMKSGDTVAAINNYKKSLALDSGNRRAKDIIKKLEKKE